MEGARCLGGDVREQPKREKSSYRLDVDVLAFMRERQERTGVTVAVQVRRALRQWLEREQEPRQNGDEAAA